MKLEEINLSEFSNDELLDAQNSVDKFLKVLNAEYADAKKKEEEKS